jgi:hypothetical protein
MSSAKPAPEPKGWIGLFIDGIKLIIITVVYAIPIWILTLIPLAAYGIAVLAGSEPLLCPEIGIVVALVFLVLFLLAAIVVGILATFAMVRFSPDREDGRSLQGSAPSSLTSGRSGG